MLSGRGSRYSSPAWPATASPPASTSAPVSARARATASAPALPRAGTRCGSFAPPWRRPLWSAAFCSAARWASGPCSTRWRSDRSRITRSRHWRLGLTQARRLTEHALEGRTAGAPVGPRGPAEQRLLPVLGRQWRTVTHQLHLPLVQELPDGLLGVRQAFAR